MKRRAFESLISQHLEEQDEQRASLAYILKHKDKEFMRLAFYNWHKQCFPDDPLHPSEVCVDFHERGEILYVRDTKRDRVIFSSLGFRFYGLHGRHKRFRRQDIWKNPIFLSHESRDSALVEDMIRLLPDRARFLIFSHLPMEDLLVARKVWPIPVNFWKIRVPFCGGVLHPLRWMHPNEKDFEHYPYMALRLAEAVLQKEGKHGKLELQRRLKCPVIAVWDKVQEKYVVSRQRKYWFIYEHRMEMGKVRELLRYLADHHFAQQKIRQ